MKLYVMRHAFAGDALDDPKAERERPLKPEGVAVAKAVAAQLASDDEIPSVIFCSPLARTTQTADIIGKALGVQVNIIGDLAPNRPLAPTILELMFSSDIKRFMIVVHVDNSTPAFQDLGGDWDDLCMAECRKLKIDRDTGEWKILWSLKPSDLGLKDYK